MASIFAHKIKPLDLWLYEKSDSYRDLKLNPFKAESWKTNKENLYKYSLAMLVTTALWSEPATGMSINNYVDQHNNIFKNIPTVQSSRPELKTLIDDDHVMDVSDVLEDAVRQKELSKSAAQIFLDSHEVTTKPKESRLTRAANKALDKLKNIRREESKLLSGHAFNAENTSQSKIHMR